VTPVRPAYRPPERARRQRNGENSVEDRAVWGPSSRFQTQSTAVGLDVLTTDGSVCSKALVTHGKTADTPDARGSDSPGHRSCHSPLVR
jgi:hypothetical protein